MSGSFLFTYLLTKRFEVYLPLLIGYDWLVVNFINRITDVKEDETNGMYCSPFVKKYSTSLLIGALLSLASSFIFLFIIILN
eukprot:UN26026